MNTFLEILLVITAFISVIPVVNLSKNQEDRKYACLKLLIYTTAFWTLLIFLERTVTSLSFVYYTHMLGFPIKFLLASLMLCTIFQYIEKNIPKWVLGLLAALFIGEFVIAFTNNSTNLLLNLSIDSMVSFKDLYSATNNILFYVHLVLSYGVLLLSVFYMFVFLSKNKGVRQYKPVSKTMIISVFIVLSINLLEFLVIDTYVDLTYISLVFVAHSLYLVIYRQDMIFNLRTSGRGEILYNMREMYVLTDQDKVIVDINPALLEKYSIDAKSVLGNHFDKLISLLEDKVVLYHNHDMNIETDETKDHYHLREKVFKIKGMSGFGYMILLYDETQVYKLLRELNNLSNFDMMTGLHNRNYIEYIFSKIKDTKKVGIISMDLNGLKVNNDYLGHERGDYLLKTLANNLKIATADVENKEIARIGGDEFLVVLPNTTEKMINSILKKIKDICHSDSIEDLVSVSLGLAYNSSEDLNIYQLVHKADKEMYLMKEKTSSIYREKMIEHIKLQNKFIR